MDDERDVSPNPSLSEPSDVACDACIGRKRKAEQTCLLCLASYCENHLDMHNILHVSAKRHKLVAATRRLDECLCPEHDKLMEVFCRTDQQCICHLCVMDQHRAHDVVSLDYEVAEAKVKLWNTQRDITDQIKTRQREMQELEQAAQAFKMSAKQALEESERSFTELIHSIQMRQCEVKKLILAQEEAALMKAMEHLEQLPSEISELKKRDFELQRLEQLYQADDGVRFLQGILSTPELSSSLSTSVLLVPPYSSFQLVSEAIKNLVKQMNLVCDSNFTRISEHVKKAKLLTSPVLKLRDVLLKNVSILTLNLDTAHPSLSLTEENRVVTALSQNVAPGYPDHPDRFDCRAQILCNECLQGTPQYWEVEYAVSGGNNWVCVAVSYIGIGRKGKRGRLFGRNRYSWGLRCYPACFKFWHNNKHISVKQDKPCSKIGVYLDHGLGILEFYNVSDDMSLIYKAQIKFTEPVYAGFGLGGKGIHFKLCDLDARHE